MGLMEKFKNLFTDEEIIEEEDEPVKIKEVKKEVEKTKEEITVTKEVEVKQVVKKLPKTGM